MLGFKQGQFAPIVHPETNTGKEPLQVRNGECGVHPNLISIIAKHRAFRPVN
jgi:hypothetical protein